MTPILVATIMVTLGFSFTNGFMDASNSVATAVASRALTPRPAVVLAAVMNAAGGLVSIGIATALIDTLDVLPLGDEGIIYLLSGVTAAVIWNLLTWWWGIPASASHAMIAGVLGASMIATRVDITPLIAVVVIPLIVSPIVGVVLGWLGMRLVTRVFCDRDRTMTVGLFRYAQTVSGATLSFVHGVQDSQRSIALIASALALAGLTDGGVPWWVIVACALTIGAGTLAGGWRVTRTMAYRITKIDSARGFVAETASASVLAVSAFAFALPVSTTHMVVSSIVGTGLQKSWRTINWRVVRSAFITWWATPVASALLGALFLVIARSLM